jgi:TonB family protein
VLVAGAALRFTWLVAGLLHLRRLRRVGDPLAPGDEQDDLDTLASASADVRYVRGLGQPVTFGVLKPVVLLPQSLRSQPTPVQRAVFVHELWHVRRRDWLWVVIEEAVRAVLWFHPAIGWLVSRVQSSREEVVDELTVLSTNARRSYLEALLTFADEPRVYPATPFARRRHLFHRMLLISREAVMSSRRIVATCAAMGTIVVMGGWYGVAAFPLRAVAVPPAGLVSVVNQSGLPRTEPVASGAQGQPRDLRPGEPRPASSRETELRAAVTAQPALNGYLELSRLQEARGATNEAEATLTEARAALPGERTVLMALASFYNRTGRFDQAVQATDEASNMAPSDATGQFVVATFYEEKIRRDTRLSASDRAKYIRAGITATDRALSIDPDYVEALIIKNILLRHQASHEANDAARAQLIGEADELRSRALELQKTRRPLSGANQSAFNPAQNAGMPPPPPPPPPPPAFGTTPEQLVDGQAPVRVGGGISAPTKIRNVPPVYPPLAMSANVTGVVIIEATIDTTGAVADAKVLRSIPLLDQAALDAVKQWQFTPTLLNGQAVPVIMTMTVNFTLQ